MYTTQARTQPTNHKRKKYDVYVLECEQGKYYVGKTTNIEKRINDHLNGNGSQWTKTYKPKPEPIKVYKDCSAFDEDKYTIEMMSIYGIDNVRGGTFTQMKLGDDDI